MKKFLGKHKGVEAICDPSSQQLSMSRFLLGIIVLIYWPMNCVMDFLLHFFKAGKMENWVVLGVMTGAIAGIYWFNSTAGSWQRKGEPVPGSWEKESPVPCTKAATGTRGPKPAEESPEGA